MPAQTNIPERLYLKVYTRKGIIFDEEVKSVTSYNDTGKFDVLQMHTQFISKIKQSISIDKVDGSNIVYPVGDAIMRVKGEQVEVFLGIKTA